MSSPSVLDPEAMSPRQPLVLATLLCPSLQSQGETPPQRYDYSYQLYQEDDDRIKIESHHLRGQIELNDATSFRFQWLHDRNQRPPQVLPSEGLAHAMTH